jgi:hypothetical protein
MIIAEPSVVEEYVQKSEKLQALFEGVDIQELSRELRKKERTSPFEKAAAAMTDEELFAFIDGNEGLRTWLLEQPEVLAENIAQNEKLKQFFEGTDIIELALRYRTYWGGSNA